MADLDDRFATIVIDELEALLEEVDASNIKYVQLQIPKHSGSICQLKIYRDFEHLTCNHKDE